MEKGEQNLCMQSKKSSGSVCVMHGATICADTHIKLRLFSCGKKKKKVPQFQASLVLTKASFCISLNAL